MSRSATFRPRIWWATLGKWGTLSKNLERFDDTARGVLMRKASSLVDRLVSNVPSLDIASFVNKALPVAAGKLAAKQFEEVLDVARRLVDEGVDPSGLLVQGVPALAGNSRALPAFSTNLLYLEALLANMQRRNLDIGKPFWVAFRAAAKDLETRQLTSSLVLANRLAEDGQDPSEMLRFSATTAANVLSAQQFRLAMTLSTHAVKRGCPVGQLLGRDLPDAAHEVSSSQLTAALRLAAHLEDKGVGLKDFFRTGLPAIAQVSSDDAQFQKNLDMISLLLLRLQEKKIRIEPPLNAMAGCCTEATDFQNNIEALYRFCLVVAQHGVPPGELMRFGLPGSIPFTTQTFQDSLQILRSITVRLCEAKINSRLLIYIIEYGLERVARNVNRFEEYQLSLVTLMKSFRQLVHKDIEPAGHKKALRSIKSSPESFLRLTEQMPSDMVTGGGLAILYELAASTHCDWREIGPERIAQIAAEAMEMVSDGTPFVVEVAVGGQPEIHATQQGHAAFRSTSSGNHKQRESKRGNQATSAADGQDTGAAPKQVRP